MPESGTAGGTVEQIRLAPPTKVSVIVPTYCPGPGLDRVIASLDAQTMPQAEFESVFVDDGSPDDTLERLKALAAERPNMRVTSIPNSGWPSRPRNVGLDMAVGEFVVFMDHDDHLYPRALEAAYDCAVEQAADVVCGKEVRSNQLFAYWAPFQRDVDASEPKRPQTLSPWTTHKLFRRSLLVEHGIRFPEGARVLWEDVMVDMEVYAATDRIAVLASEPFYQWVHTPGTNASSTYGHDTDLYVRALENLYDRIDDGPADDGFKTFMTSYQYGLRVLAACAGPRILRLDQDTAERTLCWARDFAERRIPVELDGRQSKVNRARAELLRAGDWSALRSLAEVDRGARAVPTVTDMAWNDAGALVLDVEATWHHRDGEPMLFRRSGDRLLRHLPPDLAGALSPDVQDVTADLARVDAALAVTSRSDRVCWPVRMTSEVVERAHPEAGAGVVTVGVRGRAVLDPATAALGRALSAGAWVLSLRTAFMGHSSHQAFEHAGAGVVGLTGGALAAAVPLGSGRLVVDLGLQERSVLAVTRPRAQQAEVRGRGLLGQVLRVPVDGLDGVGVPGGRQLEVRLRRLGADSPEDPLLLPARLLEDRAGVTLECPVPRVPTGRYRVLVRDLSAGVAWTTRMVLVSGRLRRLSVGVADVGPGNEHQVWGGDR